MSSVRLYVNFARIGDLVMNTPMMQLLASEKKLVTLTRGFGTEILKNEAYIDEFLVLSHPNRKESDLRNMFDRERTELKKRLGELQVDEVVVNQKEAPNIMQMLKGFLPDADFKILRADREGLHHIEYHRKLLESIDLDTASYVDYPFLTVPESNKQKAREYVSAIGERVIAFQLGAQKTDRSNPIRRVADPKCPPWEMWVKLVDVIWNNKQADGILIHGSPREAELFVTLRKMLPEEQRSFIHDGTQNISLEMSPAILAECRAMISPDTGPAHIAAAVACPLLVLFGPSDAPFYEMKGTAPVCCIVAPDRSFENLSIPSVLESWSEFESGL